MTIPRPSITFIGNTPNRWSNKGLHPKACVVVHVAEGSREGVVSWFQNPQAQASSNYLVCKNGDILCFIDPGGPDAPFANGLLNQPDADVTSLVARESNANPNYWSISIETERMHTEPLEPAQLHSLAWLIAFECERNGIPMTEHFILGHYEFDNVTRHDCPGLTRAGWIELEAEIAKITQSGANDPNEADFASIEQALLRIHKRFVPASESTAEPTLAMLPGQPGDE